MNQQGGYAYSLKLHMSLAKGGSVYVRELTDFPGITITDTRQ